MRNETKYRETAKFRAWVSFFTDKRNNDTYGNATKSALKAYKTDSYSTAGVIGHQNIKKYKNLAKMIADQEGYGFAELMKLGIEKVKDGKYSDWESFMRLIGYFEDQKTQDVNNQFNFNYLGDAILQARTDRGLPV